MIIPLIIVIIFGVHKFDISIMISAYPRKLDSLISYNPFTIVIRLGKIPLTLLQHFVMILLPYKNHSYNTYW